MSIAVNESEPVCPNCRRRGEENDDGSYECPQPSKACRVERFVGDEPDAGTDSESEGIGSSISDIRSLLSAL